MVKSIGVLKVIEPPYKVASLLKILTPVVTAITMVDTAKADIAQPPRPTENMWWAHTPKPKNAITAPARTIVV